MAPAAGLVGKAKGLLPRARRARPSLDHVVRAYQRYKADAGDRLAAAVTYFGFLSFFPLMALVFAITGFVVSYYPDAQQEVVKQVNSYLPGLADKLNVADLGHAKAGTGIAGIVGLAGLLLAGLGWLDALRDAIRTMWHHNLEAGNVVVKKLLDVLILAGLGLTLLASLIVSGLATTATDWVLGFIGLKGNGIASFGFKALGILVAVLVDTAVFVYLFTRLPRLRTPLRRVLKGALLGAVGLEVLKVVGSFLVSRTTKNPVYGAFAVVVGLLIWINFVSRFTLFVAAWTVTAPYDTDVAPSGTASAEAARKAGIPEEYADSSPDDVPTTVGGGAPSPLHAALQGAQPPQDQSEGPESVGAPDGDGQDGRDRAGGGDDSTDGGARAGGRRWQALRRRDEPADKSERAGEGSEAGQHRVARAEAALAPAAGPAATTPTVAGPTVAGPAATTPTVAGLPHERAVRTAGRVGAGAIVAGMAGVALYAARAVRAVVRS